MSTENTSRPTGTDRAHRGEFMRLRRITTRWMDNDVYGHVNNVIYYSFFDTAVNAALIEEGLLDPVASDSICLVVETGCRYFEALSFPETIEAGIRVDHLGGSSVRYAIGLFREGAELAAAQGHFVHVNVDAKTRRPKPFAEAMRAFLSSLREPGQ